MVQYSDVQEHTAENITMLCGSHHDQKTRHMLPLAQVQAANAKPYNLQAGHTSPFLLRPDAATPTIHLGGNAFCTQGSFFSAIAVDNLNLAGVRVEDRHLLLNATFFDESNNIVCTIQDNELTASTGLEDMNLVGVKPNENTGKPGGARLTIAGAGFSLSMLFHAEGLDIESGTLLCNGVRIDLHSDGSVTVNGTSPIIITGSWFTGMCGIALGRSEGIPSAGIRLRNISRYAIPG